MQPLPFAEARATVLRLVGSAPADPPAPEIVPLMECAGRVLAADVLADRSYPARPRSIRDGFAVRAGDFPRGARIVGEVRAGESFPRSLVGGEAVEIMTGAPVPEGADAVIMVEHAVVTGDRVTTERNVSAGDFIVPAGAEAEDGSAVLPAGVRLDFAHIAALATVGRTKVSVYRRPEIAILATGDEVTPVENASPAPHQVRNSNSYSLAAQVSRAGGAPRILPVAPDAEEATRALIETGLQSDLLLLSGGVSAGKYDLVEKVLSDLGAEFYFDRVLIQPGQPLVFGRVRDRFFFGLPGNPASTMVTFELFARAAVEILSGIRKPTLPLVQARLTTPFRHRCGLTRFLPAWLEGGELTPVPWQGSGDVFALARANAFLMAREDRESWEKGDWMEVLPR